MKCTTLAVGFGLIASTLAQSTTYNCNPAHSYPNGATCISTAGSLTLVTPGGQSTTTPAHTTTYACNPAHSYPYGATCISTAGSLTLVMPTLSTTARQSTTLSKSSSTSYPSSSEKLSSITKSYNPVTSTTCSNSSSKLTTASFSWPMPPRFTTKVVTAFTACCPSPTTLQYNNETMTISKPTTVTISSCRGGCTITQPIITTKPVNITTQSIITTKPAKCARPANSKPITLSTGNATNQTYTARTTKQNTAYLTIATTLTRDGQAYAVTSPTMVVIPSATQSFPISYSASTMPPTTPVVPGTTATVPVEGDGSISGNGTMAATPSQPVSPYTDAAPKVAVGGVAVLAMVAGIAMM